MAGEQATAQFATKLLREFEYRLDLGYPSKVTIDLFLLS
jgi:hypothetical protein